MSNYSGGEMYFDKIILFTVASYLIGSIPGPSVLFTITHSMRYGTGKTIFTIFGQITGNLVFIGLLLLGFEAFIVENYTAFSIMKYLGASYLFYLAYRMFKTDFKYEQQGIHFSGKSHWYFYVDGLIVSLSNPKLFLYYVAFLPLFVIQGENEFFQLLIFGCLSLLIGFSILLVYVYAANFIRIKLSGYTAEKYLNKSSAILITLAALLILVYN